MSLTGDPYPLARSPWGSSSVEALARVARDLADREAAHQLHDAALARHQQDPEFHARVALAVRVCLAAHPTVGVNRHAFTAGAAVALHLDDLARERT